MYRLFSFATDVICSGSVVVFVTRVRFAANQVRIGGDVNLDSIVSDPAEPSNPVSSANTPNRSVPGYSHVVPIPFSDRTGVQIVSSSLLEPHCWVPPPFPGPMTHHGTQNDLQQPMRSLPTTPSPWNPSGVSPRTRQLIEVGTADDCSLPCTGHMFLGAQ